MKDLINYLVDIYTTTLAPRVNEVIASGFKFFRLIDIDPEGAAQHAGAAIVTLAAFVIVTVFIAKSIKALSSAFSVATKLIKWVVDTIVQISSSLQSTLQNVILTGFPKLFTAAPYIALLSWAAMLDPLSARRIARDYKDGSVHVRYQRNMGLSVLVLCVWSSLAFGYAVYASGASFGKEHAYLTTIAMLGAVVYGMLILTLDRSIVAPFTSLIEERQLTNLSMWERVKRDGYALLPSLLKLVARVVVAVFVAKFTALPLTMLVLHGGIVDIKGESVRADRAEKEERLVEVQEGRLLTIQTRTTSKQCLVSVEAVEKSQKRIDEMARAGCKNGKPTCPADGTEFFEKMHRGHVKDQQIACSVPALELKTFDDEIARLSKELAIPIAERPVDVLQGASILEVRALAQSDNQYFQPIPATYYLLFIIELIPLFLKLWKSPLVKKNERLSA